MTKAPLSRLRLYVDCGYSAPRLSELMEWPLNEVQAVKGFWGLPPKAYKKRAHPKQKIVALNLVRDGKTIPEAAREANVCVKTLRIAIRKAKRAGTFSELSDVRAEIPPLAPLSQ